MLRLLSKVHIANKATGIGSMRRVQGPLPCVSASGPSVSQGDSALPKTEPICHTAAASVKVDFIKNGLAGKTLQGPLISLLLP